MSGQELVKSLQICEQRYLSSRHFRIARDCLGGASFGLSRRTLHTRLGLPHSAHNINDTELASHYASLMGLITHKQLRTNGFACNEQKLQRVRNCYIEVKGFALYCM